VPVAPLLFALSMAGAEQLAKRLAGASDAAPDGATPCQPLWLPWAVVVVAGLGGGFLPWQSDPGSKKRGDAELDCVKQGFLIRENTQPAAKLAVFWAGATPYFAERIGIDLLGKCDPVIAREDAKPGLMKPGHNKYDFAHSLAQSPDVVVCGSGAASIKQLEAMWKDGPYRAFYELFLVPDFTQRYALVGGDDTKLPPDLYNASRYWHAIFVRRDTQLARPPAEWVAPR
jgi:hypothetical protein